MTNYEGAKVKLKYNHPNRFKSAEQSDTETTLRIKKKKIKFVELSYEFFLTTRQTIKCFGSNISEHAKLTKAPLSKIIQSGGFFGTLLDKFTGLLMKVTVPDTKKF